MPWHDVRWIFFDVGYTLLDETAAWREQFGRLAEQTGTTVDGLFTHFRNACTSFQPRQWRAVVEAAVGPNPGRIEQLMTLSAGWRHDLEAPYRGVEPMLGRLAQRYRLGIIANQSAGTADRLAKHGLLRHLSVVVGSAEAGVVKPDPAIFHYALRQADCSAANAVMVGDRLDNDVRPASRLGMRTVHVRQGGSAAQRARTPDETPTYIIEAVTDLEALFAPSPDASSGQGV